ncbi:MAG TPA: hypothetical protein VMS31_18215 [Pyrinomonadaceae bacterium]|nr:hypothetical protein [Pyrinomonadaceae bacterium]
MRLPRFTTTTLFVMITLAVCPTAFAQRPGGGPPGGGPGQPGGGPGGGRPGDGHPHPGPGGPPPRDQRPAGPRGPQADFLSSEMRFGDRVVKGSPYSAQFFTENTQTLADGTRITRKSDGVVYRNGEGRTRREQKVGALGPIPMEGEPRQVIFINDPVAGAHYVLDVQDRSARKMPFREGPPPPAGPPPPEFQGPPDDVKVESLGKQTIEGVEAEGTRSTITIPVGRIGNDRPLKVVSERWFSPELKIVVLSKHNDPFAGENVYRLTRISREEPPLSMFTVPAEYRITEEHPPEPPRRPRQ